MIAWGTNFWEMREMLQKNDLMIKARLRRILGDDGVRLLKKVTGRDQFDECRLVHQAFKAHGQGGVMLDVGAHHGIELAMFVSLGWRVYAFEPDPKNRQHLVTSFGNHPRVSIDTRAVSDTAGQELAFFTSDVSTGISGLSAFHASHTETQKVVTTTIAEFVAEEKITRIDFLKIDVEGFDFFVIKGIDWNGVTPDVILWEFEDSKTLPLGYSAQDAYDYLIAKDYKVTISEWHPIGEYGQKHSWKRFCDSPGELSERAWGNMIAFRDRPQFQELASENIDTLARRNFPTHYQPA